MRTRSTIAWRSSAVKSELDSAASRGALESTPAPRVQVFYSPDDQVVSVPALLSAFDAIRSPQKELIPVLESGEPSAHVLAGDIISPDNTVPIAGRIVDFILRRAP